MPVYVHQVSVRAVVDGVEDNSDDTWEDPRGRGRRGRGGREGSMGRRGPPGQQEEEKEYAVSCWHPTSAVFKLPADSIMLLHLELWQAQGLSQQRPQEKLR
jgi:hypothetical protein